MKDSDPPARLPEDALRVVHYSNDACFCSATICYGWLKTRIASEFAWAPISMSLQLGFGCDEDAHADLGLTLARKLDNTPWSRTEPQGGSDPF